MIGPELDLAVRLLVGGNFHRIGLQESLVPGEQHPVGAVVQLGRVEGREDSGPFPIAVLGQSPHDWEQIEIAIGDMDRQNAIGL